LLCVLLHLPASTACSLSTFVFMYNGNTCMNEPVQKKCNSWRSFSFPFCRPKKCKLPNQAVQHFCTRRHYTHYASGLPCGDFFSCAEILLLQEWRNAHCFVICCLQWSARQPCFCVGEYVFLRYRSRCKLTLSESVSVSVGETVKQAYCCHCR
jgi:hypothetical protein